MDLNINGGSGALNGARHPQHSDSDLEESQNTSNMSQRDVSHALGEKMLQGWTLLGDQCPRCLTILVRNRQRELFCVSCDMFIRNEPPPDKEESAPPSSTQPQPQPQPHGGTAEMQPGNTETAEPSILNRQHEVAQALSLSLLDKMLDISKDVAETSNAQECEQLLALLRNCLGTYRNVAEELM